MYSPAPMATPASPSRHVSFVDELRSWGLHTAAAGAAGATFGATKAFLRSQPLAFLASAYAVNCTLFAGSVLGGRQLLLHWAPYPESWSARHASSAISAGAFGGLATHAVSGPKKGALGVLLWAGAGYLAQDGVDALQAWRTAAGRGVLQERALLSRLTDGEREAFAAASSRSTSDRLKLAAMPGSGLKLPQYLSARAELQQQQGEGGDNTASGGVDAAHRDSPIQSLERFVDAAETRRNVAAPRPSLDRAPLPAAAGAARVVDSALPAAPVRPGGGGGGGGGWMPFRRLEEGEAAAMQLKRLRTRLNEVEELLGEAPSFAAAQREQQPRRDQ